MHVGGGCQALLRAAACAGCTWQHLSAWGVDAMCMSVRPGAPPSKAIDSLRLRPSPGHMAQSALSRDRAPQALMPSLPGRTGPA